MTERGLLKNLHVEEEEEVFLLEWALLEAFSAKHMVLGGVVMEDVFQEQVVGEGLADRMDLNVGVGLKVGWVSNCGAEVEEEGWNSGRSLSAGGEGEEVDGLELSQRDLPW